ncbi:holo-ACP synthase [Pokkaliibacter sp. CJK22405]|uniref:holo-ACP synthase n=1 Tax=Pokkaliibacter sp. CJK22405 TaxID=3384615 RepID=UPI0039849F09
MICGIGTDLVAVARIAAIHDKTRERFARKILGPEELVRYQELAHPVPWLAKRWAAKEATAKALSHGIGRGLSMTHIQVLNHESGAPRLVLTDKALTLAQAMGATHWHISLSDEADYALAFVVLSA